MHLPKNASQHDTANLRSNMPQGLQKICTYGLQVGKIFYRGMPAVTWKIRVFAVSSESPYYLLAFMKGS